MTIGAFAVIFRDMNELEYPTELRNFRLMSSGRSVDLIEHIEHMRLKFPLAEVHLGCDSQNTGKRTTYVTAVVFRFAKNGAHVIYRRERIPRINDMWTKLWGETERSVMHANFIHEELSFRVKQIDLDFNSDPAFPSNKLLGASEGYIKSLGYVPKAKPHLLMAAWAANVLCQ